MNNAADAIGSVANFLFEDGNKGAGTEKAS